MEMHQPCQLAAQDDYGFGGTTAQALHLTELRAHRVRGYGCSSEAPLAVSLLGLGAGRSGS
jgi:hypothetical protein